MDIFFPCVFLTNWLRMRRMFIGSWKRTSFIFRYPKNYTTFPDSSCKGRHKNFIILCLCVIWYVDTFFVNATKHLRKLVFSRIPWSIICKSVINPSKCTCGHHTKMSMCPNRNQDVIYVYTLGIIIKHIKKKFWQILKHGKWL